MDINNKELLELIKKFVADFGSSTDVLLTDEVIGQWIEKALQDQK